jgi:Fe-S-cluster-containing hydrogenase component 2/flavodoxin
MIELFFFSGTGNCEYVANELARAFTDVNIHRITHQLIQEQKNYEADKIIIIYPTYAYGFPKIVHKFLREVKLKAPYKALITTFASAAGNSLAQSYRYRQSFDYCATIKTVENFTPLFRLPSDETIEKILKVEKEQVELVVAQIKDHIDMKIKRSHPLGLINKLFLLFQPMLSKMIKQNNYCIDCRQCEGYCLNKAISFKNDKFTVDSARCDLCCSCLNRCAVGGLTLMRHNHKAKRYVHPVATDER